jgi:Rad3-related DNA helicase
MADLMLRDEGITDLLPAADTVVFDEAHQLPDTATRFLGNSLSTHQLLDLAKLIEVAGLAHARELTNWSEQARRIEHTARELRWLLLSPPLLDTAPGAHSAPVQQFSPAERGAISAWLDGIDRAPQALYEAVHAITARGTDLRLARPPSLRLGRRAERLMAFFLRYGPTHCLVAANIPLRHLTPDGDRTTLGEIDFLLHDVCVDARGASLCSFQLVSHCQTTGGYLMR